MQKGITDVKTIRYFQKSLSQYKADHARMKSSIDDKTSEQMDPKLSGFTTYFSLAKTTLVNTSKLF